MSLLQTLLFDRVIPCVFDAGLTLFIVLAILKLFKVKDPATRFVFLFLPLLKSFMVLIERASTTTKPTNTHSFAVGIRLPGPLSFIQPLSKDSLNIIYDPSSLTIALLIAMALIFFLIVARWVQLYLFLNGLKKKEPLSKKDYPEVYHILASLADKFNAEQPKLVLADNYTFVPFSVSVREPIIILSQSLLDTFPKEQIEIMLAHELAHIKRRDNFSNWLALLLRDIMFFNPLAYLACRMLEEEMEKTCDRIALEITGEAPRAIVNTLVDVAIFHQVSPSKDQQYPVLTKSLLSSRSAIEQRIKALKLPLKNINPSRIRTGLKALAFLLLLYIQPTIIVKLGEHLLLLH